MKNNFSFLFIFFIILFSCKKESLDFNKNSDSLKDSVNNKILEIQNVNQLKGQKVITDCPMYPYSAVANCGPITVGNLFSYWEMHGYKGLFPGNLSSATKNDIYVWMSSSLHDKDYCVPSYPLADKSELGGAHANDCIADFLGTGFSSLDCPDKMTKPLGLLPGIENYVKHYTKYKSECKEYNFYSFPWDSIVSNIDRNHPMLALVNMDNDDTLWDHWTLVIGYNDTGVKKYFNCVSLQGQLSSFPYTQIYENASIVQWRITRIYTFNIQ